MRQVDVLLIGGGVASVRCARTLRREGFAGSILLVGDEPMAPYNRPPLSKELLRDDLPHELMLAEPLSWYGRRRIELVVANRVTAIDPESRVAILEDGERVTAASILIATGSRPRLPSFPGAERALLLRTPDDARRIREIATADARVVIIGGGLIGVEVASVLAELGRSVTIVELSDRLWGGAFGFELAAWARVRLGELGVTVRLASPALSIEADGVRVGDEVVPADAVIAGLGVVPNVDLARAAGLPTADGILTDRAHRTAAAGIHAAGDVARVTGHRVEHWHAAREGGDAAARSILGLPTPPVVPTWVFTELAGTTVDIVGEVASDTEGWVVPNRVLVFATRGRAVGIASISATIEPHVMRSLVADGATPAQVRAAVHRR